MWEFLLRTERYIVVCLMMRTLYVLRQQAMMQQ